MPELMCPVCGQPLILEGKTYRCETGHCFDCAKSGYVNLLPPAPSGKRHGDDKLMVKARTDFLDKGYYDPLSRASSVIPFSSCPQPLPASETFPMSQLFA